MNPCVPLYTAITPEIAARIREAVGEEAVVVDPDRLEPFGKDATELFRLPELLVEAVSTEQVQQLLRLANHYGFPVTPRGLGTGLTGGAVPLFGGVLLSLAKMNQILSLDSKNLIAVVEPGVVTGDLRKAAQSRGLF